MLPWQAAGAAGDDGKTGVADVREIRHEAGRRLVRHFRRAGWDPHLHSRIRQPRRPDAKVGTVSQGRVVERTEKAYARKGGCAGSKTDDDVPEARVLLAAEMTIDS